MFAISKVRPLALLGILLVLSSIAHSADAPLSKELHTTSEETQMIPRRAPQPLSRREIFRVIQTDLAQKGFSGVRALRPEDLRIQSSLPSTVEDMGLTVKSIGYDPLRRETVFELWALHAPNYLPFKVTARIDPQSLGLASVVTGTSEESPSKVRAATGRGAPSPALKPPLLARPGTPATLVLLGQNIHITTSVEPLQSGVQGQHILVRDLTTARVMSAEVVGDGLLQASF